MARRSRGRKRREQDDERARVRAFLLSVHCNREVAANVIGGTRDLYSAVQRIRLADLPPEGLAIVGQIEGMTIAFGQWLRDNGLGREVFKDGKQ